MDNFINLRILAHPFNWLTVLLWLVAIGFLVNHATGKPMHANLSPAQG